MFYQYQDNVLLWDEIRDRMQIFTITDLIKNVLNKKMSFKDLTVILIVDGMQNALTNVNDGKDKRSLFYSLLTEITVAVTNDDYPLIIACCTATIQ
jgi:hypothetical protein